MIRTQLTLFMKNEPGELARAVGEFATAKINIEGISVAERTDVSLVQLIVSNPGAARQLLKNAGTPVTEQKVAVLALANKPGALATVAANLSANKVNINYLYTTDTASFSIGIKLHLNLKLPVFGYIAFYSQAHTTKL